MVLDVEVWRVRHSGDNTCVVSQADSQQWRLVCFKKGDCTRTGMNLKSNLGFSNANTSADRCGLPDIILWNNKTARENNRV